MATKKTVPAAQQAQLLRTLKTRFEANAGRHAGVEWASVQKKLESQPAKVWSLAEMERTGGEPDVVGGQQDGAYLFIDCAAESPKERRSLCYDRAALDGRKENKPKGSAMELAAEMGAEMVTEEQYRELQRVGEFDTKTSSWIATPARIRRLGGALFCDRRFDTVFTYHNGAESYYAARGFRAALKV